MKDGLKRRILAGVLALTVSATAAGCSNNNSETSEDGKSNSSVVSILKSYNITLGGKEITLNEEEFQTLVDQVLENEKFYNRDVGENKTKSDVTITRMYGITLFGEEVQLNEEEYDMLVEQLLQYGLADYAERVSQNEDERQSLTEEEAERLYDLADAVLTTQRFEDLVAGYAKTYEDENVSVTTDDITKFAAIVNIDKLAEENPELLRELSRNKTKEEYLNDVAKVIGATVMHNFTLWNNTNSTKDFIRVSNVVDGSQKDAMLKIEEYTDRIAEAANSKDEDLVNSLVSELVTELNSGSLSKLDDGVGFGAQVCIAVIADGIAKDYLNKKNFDELQILKSSEKYVSNIFTVYDNCNNEVKVRTR